MGAIADSLREPSSIPVQVSAAIRGLIMGGQLRPGERVVEWKIARQLGIGQPTAREALLLLEGEGLLRRNANRGCTVTSLSLTEIDQIYRVRIELEPLAAELVVENAANWTPEAISLALKNLHSSAKAGDIDAWRRSDVAFHQLLWRLAANPFLERALSQICIPFFAFAGMVYVQQRPRDLVHQADQHALIVAAILSKRKKDARRVTRDVLGEFWKVWLAQTKHVTR